MLRTTELCVHRQDLDTGFILWGGRKVLAKKILQWLDQESWGTETLLGVKLDAVTRAWLGRPCGAGNPVGLAYMHMWAELTTITQAFPGSSLAALHSLSSASCIIHKVKHTRI